MENSLGQKLRALREQQGLTLKQLFERSGVSLSHISALERGERVRPSYDRLYKLAKALGVSPSYFTGESTLDERERTESVRDILLSLPTDLQEFIAKEDSVPYILLAKRLAEAGEDGVRVVESIADFLKSRSVKNSPG